MCFMVLIEVTTRVPKSTLYQEKTFEQHIVGGYYRIVVHRNFRLEKPISIRKNGDF